MPHVSPQVVEIYKGKYRTVVLQVFDDFNNPQDLEGLLPLMFSVKKRVLDDNAETLITLTSGTPQFEITDELSGICRLHFYPEATQDLDQGGYVFDIQATHTLGFPIQIVRVGNFVVLPVVRRTAS